MKIFPSEKIELVTSLNKADVGKLLRDNVQPARALGEKLQRKKNLKAFEGEIGWDKFEVQRTINHRNSFLPKIRGIVEDHSSGSKISLEFKFPVFVLVFMTFWLGFVLIFLVIGILGYEEEAVDIGSLLIPAGMLIFGTAVPYISYKYERNRAIEELEKILKARKRKPYGNY